MGAVVLPFLGFVAALVLLWNRLVGWSDIAILAGTYVATGLGVTVGYHRLLTHRVVRDASLGRVPARGAGLDVGRRAR